MKNMSTQKQHKKIKKAASQTEPRLSPQEYRKYLKQTELKSIILISCSARMRSDYFAESMKHSVTDRVKYEISEPNIVKLLHEYQFIITKSTKRDYAVKIVCEFEVELVSEEEISEKFVEIFAKVNLHMNTWPYFREFVQNMLQRMGLPLLTLPFLKS